MAVVDSAYLGGLLTQATQGLYDSFNELNQQGNPKDPDINKVINRWARVANLNEAVQRLGVLGGAYSLEQLQADRTRYANFQFSIAYVFEQLVQNADRVKLYDELIAYAGS